MCGLHRVFQWRVLVGEEGGEKGSGLLFTCNGASGCTSRAELGKRANKTGRKGLIKISELTPIAGAGV